VHGIFYGHCCSDYRQMMRHSSSGDRRSVFYLASCCCGDYRQMTRHSSGHKRSVFYLAPCRRRLRNESEVDLYLNLTDSQLTIDLFCFDADLRVDVEFSSKQVRTDSTTGVLM